MSFPFRHEYKKGETFHEVLGEANLTSRGKPVDCKKVDNNTFLRRVYPSEDINLELYGNVIAIFLKSGGMVLSSCGYRTVTTKARLHAILPERCAIYSQKGEWKFAVWKAGENAFGEATKVYEFIDGMTITEKKVVGGAPLAPVKIKKGAKNG